MLHIELINEPTAKLGNDVPHVAVDRVYPSDGGVENVLGDTGWHPPAYVLRADRDYLRNSRCNERRVVLDEPDTPTFSKSLKWLRSRAREHDRDALADAMHVDAELLLEPHSERNEYNDGDGAPDDSESGEESAELLGAKVLKEF